MQTEKPGTSSLQDRLIGRRTQPAGGSATLAEDLSSLPALSAEDSHIDSVLSYDDDVDPVAEADVYIAYGRHNQALEILQEAYQRNKTRPEILLKLLEIFAFKKSLGDFELWESRLLEMSHVPDQSRVLVAQLRNQFKLGNSAEAWAAEGIDDKKELGVRADQGQTKVEQLAQTDHLGRERITRSLTQLLTHRSDTKPLAIGLFGHWGSGKSSQIEFLKHALVQTERPRVQVVEFNAWQHERSENMGAALAQTLLESSVRERGFFDQLRLAARFAAAEQNRLKHSLRIDANSLLARLGPWTLLISALATPAVVMALLAGLLFNASGAHLWLQSLGSSLAILWVTRLSWRRFIAEHLTQWFKPSAAAPSLGRHFGLPDFRAQIGVFHAIQASLANLCALCLKADPDPREGDYLLVVVDDLDRCSAKAVKEVFDAVRLVAQVERVVTLVAIDERIAFAAVTKHFEDFGASARAPHLLARDYLAKVFQVAITLPEASAQAADDFIRHELFATPSRVPKRDAGPATSPALKPLTLAPRKGFGSSKPNADAPDTQPQIQRQTLDTLPEEINYFAELAAACGFNNPRQLWRLKQAWLILKGLVITEGSKMSVLKPWMRVLFLREYILQATEDERRTIQAWLDDDADSALPAPAPLAALSQGSARLAFASYSARVTAVNIVLLPSVPFLVKPSSSSERT